VIPENYVLGAGHVKFFYNKIEYLISRYRELTIELLARGYNIERKSLEFSFPEIPNEWYGRWVPSEDDLALNRQRIKERMPKDPKWTLT
jgi:deoxyribonuclease (pyrimidine dimer)